MQAFAAKMVSRDTRCNDFAASGLSKRAKKRKREREREKLPLYVCVSELILFWAYGKGVGVQNSRFEALRIVRIQTSIAISDVRAKRDMVKRHPNISKPNVSQKFETPALS